MVYFAISLVVLPPTTTSRATFKRNRLCCRALDVLVRRLRRDFGDCRTILLNGKQIMEKYKENTIEAKKKERKPNIRVCERKAEAGKV